MLSGNTSDVFLLALGCVECPASFALTDEYRRGEVGSQHLLVMILWGQRLNELEFLLNIPLSSPTHPNQLNRYGIIKRT